MTMRNTEGQQSYPTAMVQIQLDGQTYTREVAVAPRLPEDVLLGTDISLTRHLILSLNQEEHQEAKELLKTLDEEKSLVMVTRAQARQQRTKPSSVIDAQAHTLPCGLEPTDTQAHTLLPCGLEPTDTKYVNNVNPNVCVLGAQSRRPSLGAGSGLDVSPEQGVKVTDSVPGERCEGRVLGGTAGPPGGSAQDLGS